MAGAAVVAGVLLRLHARSELWLDEALSVNIARLPLQELPEALRHDGSPPLYYLLLHGWTAVFGTGNDAVRLLSGLFSVAALPLAWFAGRRVAGRTGAWAALLLLATSPFAIRYATEARMYALVQLLVLAGLVALGRALERPSLGRLAVLAVVAGLLPLVHYWTVYLLAVVAVVLAVLVVRSRSRSRRPARRALVALGAGALLFVPWLPSFLYQSAHTGTPWAKRASPVHAAIGSLFDIGGAPRSTGVVVALVLQALVVLAVFGRGVDGRRVELDFRTRPEGRGEAAVAAGTMVLGLGASVVLGTAFAPRYVSVVFPLLIVLAALGTRTLLDRRLRIAMVATAAVLGLVTGALNMFFPRTQAGEVAAAITAQGRPGDVVVYCPDQLGPAVNRLLPPGYRQLPFPAGGDPRFVDWVGYHARNRAAQPVPFAQRAVELAGRDHDVWLVWVGGYRTFGLKCERVSDELARLRPAASVVFEPDEVVFERMNLTRLPPTPGDEAREAGTGTGP
ncbi:MAG: glycosyltransferase family 39 protein [Actinomycetota bacterium]|nr:glycosyltransferase family 39 protein [Actinomycetota bacterium]